MLPLLRRAQVIDVPNLRSSHVAPVPRGGGVAVAAGIAVAAYVGHRLGFDVPWYVLTATMTLAIVGWVDDVRGLSARLRLVIQLLATVGLVGFVASEGIDSGIPAILFVGVAILGVMGYTNAFNFMDGINGISAINAALAGFWFAWLGNQNSFEELTVLGLAVAGASLGFLPWNAPNAKLFLGDVGSYAVGFLLAALAVLSWADGVGALYCIAPFSIYLADTAWALSKRVLGGRSWREAHREHVYQRLVDGGWSHLACSILCATAGLVTCVLVLFLTSWDPLFAVLGVTLIAAVYLALPSLVLARRSLLEARGLQRREEPK